MDGGFGTLSLGWVILVRDGRSYVLPSSHTDLAAALIDLL